MECRRLLSLYTLIDLGTLGGDASYAYDVNNSDQVVGYAQDAAGAERGFVFADANGNGIADAGEMKDLGVLPGDTGSRAFGINDFGQVVGASTAAGPAAEPIDRAVRFSDSGPADLGLGEGSSAFAINKSGSVVGGATFAGRYLAFVRTAAGQVTPFADNPAYTFSEARGVNDTGQIVGYASGGVGDVGFLREPDGTTAVVGFPQPALVYSYAWDLNAAGQVAGEGVDSAGRYSAFRRDPEGTVTAIGTLDTYASSEAAGINAAGEVVGRAVSESASRQRAILFSGGVLYDLNDLIPSDSGWRLTDARAINDRGSIVGFGTTPSGQTHAFLLTRGQGPVRSRFVYYNNSAFDGHTPGAGAADNAAIVFGKTPLLPGGAAGNANYTNYTKGINGVMIDLVRPPSAAAPTADDFEFRVGNDSNPAGWAVAPPPSSVTVQRGGGIGGSDRVTLVWPDGAVRNAWLRVMTKANARTGLSTADVFYLGNLVGETGDRSSRAEVTAADVLRTRAQQTAESVGISSRYDHNHDGRVNVLDTAAVRGNLPRTLTFIAPPVGVAVAAAVESGSLLARSATPPRRSWVASVLSEANANG